MWAYYHFLASIMEFDDLVGFSSPWKYQTTNVKYFFF